MPSYRVFNTDPSGVFYMLYLLKTDRKREKKLCILENIKNLEEKVYVVVGGSGNLISKSHISCDCFYY